MIFNELDEIFEDAKKSYGSVKLDWHGYEARMELGIKISRDIESGEVTLYDPAKGGDYYIEMNEHQYQLFFDYGWNKAVNIISLDKYKRTIDRLNENIKREMNSMSINTKSLETYKAARVTVLKKYYKLTQKSKKL